ncbi:MAG: BolA family protein [Pseudomonadota bacterium]
MLTIELMRSRISALISPTHLEIIDDSHKHIGHTGNTGGGHFTLIISAEKLNGLSKLASHRLIYSAVNDLIPEKIHALAIKIKA